MKWGAYGCHLAQKLWRTPGDGDEVNEVRDSIGHLRKFCGNPLDYGELWGISGPFIILKTMGFTVK